MRLSGEHVIEGRELGKDAYELERAAHAARADHVWPHAEEALAVEPDVAIVRHQRARDAVEQCGLARTVRPDQPDDLPGLDRDVDAGQRRQAAEVLGDAADFEQAHAARGTSRARRRRRQSVITPPGIHSVSHTMIAPYTTWSMPIPRPPQTTRTVSESGISTNAPMMGPATVPSPPKTGTSTIRTESMGGITLNGSMYVVYCA